MKKYFIIFSLLLGSLLVAQPANATSASANAAQGLQITPASVELNAAPGKTYNINLTVTNVTSSSLSFNSLVSDFTSQGETGAPKIFQDPKLPETSSIKTWVSADSNFSLSAQQQKKIVARVTIPKDAEPGGHYGVLSFASNPIKSNGNGVGLSASAGTLIFIRVDGKITEKASLAEFSATKDNKQTSLFESSPVNLVTRIKNEGNIHVKPSGSIEIRDFFGRLVQNIEVNPDNKSNVLPNSIRRFDSEFKKSSMFGKYTANLMLSYGTNGQAITGTLDFWVIPYKMIAVIVIGLLMLIFVLVKLIKGYNQYIILKSKNEAKGKGKKHTKR